MRSMTGFGESEGANNAYTMRVTVRSVNHRYLDVAVRCRDEHRSCERLIKTTVGEAVARGRLEVSLEVESLEPKEARVEIRENVVAALHAANESLRQKGLLGSELGFAELLRVPSAVEVTLEADKWEPEDNETLQETCRKALAQVVEGREREGVELTAGITARLSSLQGIVQELTSRRSTVTTRLRENLSRRLEEILSPPLDEDRVTQEVAYLVDRSDIEEELDRLQAHIGHFRHLIAEDEPVGKRLDFLSQEVARELNTIGAKCRDSDMSRLVVDAKALSEQLREQLQNVE